MKDCLSVDLLQCGPNLYKAIVKIPAFLVNRFIDNAIESISKKNVSGFSKCEIPKEYVKQNFKQNIINHVKEFFFKYFVISRLYKEIRSKKIALLGEPRLIDCYLEQNKDAEYQLEFNFIQAQITREWKYISFKSSQRKKYKDIDKQVIDFIKEEEDQEKNRKNKDVVCHGDWVNFTISAIDVNNNPIFEESENLWARIGQDDTTIPLQEVFLDKKLGESFYTEHFILQDFFNSGSTLTNNFFIKILDIVHQDFLSIEQFKKHFKIKTNKKVHEKIVEVFSFTNDMSLRRNITTEAFDTLLKLYKIEVPEQCILRQQQIILENLQSNPDYIVYRTEPGFKEKVRALAEQQVRESALMELLAHHEDIASTEDDVKNYLNLTQRARTREFLHFLHPELAFAADAPIHTESLKQVTLREKALNHAILYLTKL